MSPQAAEARRTAQANFVKYLQKEGRVALLLVARFIARQVVAETGKMLPGGLKPAEDDFVGVDSVEYALNDHLD
jgi:import receptor subunit TOM20